MHQGIIRHIGLISGLIVTPFAMLMAIYSSGGGHGDYLLARILYPIPMLITRVTHNYISYVSIALAIAQYPAFGWLADRTAANPRWLRVLAAVVVAHAIALIFCLIGALPNFS